MYLGLVRSNGSGGFSFFLNDPAASSSQILDSEKGETVMGSIAGHMWLRPDLLNRGLVWCGLAVSLSFCVDGSVRVGDDVNREKAFLAKENMDEPFSFLAKPHTSLRLSPIESSINPASISANMMFAEVLRSLIGQFNSTSVECCLVNTR